MYVSCTMPNTLADAVSRHAGSVKVGRIQPGPVMLGDSLQRKKTKASASVSSHSDSSVALSKDPLKKHLAHEPLSRNKKISLIGDWKHNVNFYWIIKAAKIFIGQQFN